MNQTQLGNIFSKSGQTIGNWESGQNEPNVSELKQLSEFFQVPIDDLISRDISKHWTGQGIATRRPRRFITLDLPRTIDMTDKKDVLLVMNEMQNTLVQFSEWMADTIKEFDASN